MRTNFVRLRYPTHARSNRRDATPPIASSSVSLRWRLGLIAAAYVLVTLVGGLATVRAAQQWSKALDDRREWLVAAEQAARLRASYVDQETGQRGYLITGQQDFLEPYERGQSDATSLLASLKALDAKDDYDLPMSGVEQAVDDWRAEATKEIAAVRRRKPRARRVPGRRGRRPSSIRHRP